MAIPVGLPGARLYSVLTDIGFYFGHGRDWVNVFLDLGRRDSAYLARVVGGELSARGWCAAGNAPGWGPWLVQLAPALAFAQAIGRWGNYFNQQLYGRPSTLPWAVPRSRPRIAWPGT